VAEWLSGLDGPANQVAVGHQFGPDYALGLKLWPTIGIAPPCHRPETLYKSKSTASARCHSGRLPLLNRGYPPFAASDVADWTGTSLHPI
jgi:hypothetical protein